MSFEFFSGSPASPKYTGTGVGQGPLTGPNAELTQKFREWTGCYWLNGFTVK
jgi:hypothetical protein